MSDLRSKVIRLAHANPELRPHLLPLIVSDSRTAAEDKVKVLNENGREVWVNRQTLRDPKQKSKYRPIKEKSEGKDEGAGGSSTPHVDKKIMNDVLKGKGLTTDDLEEALFNDYNAGDGEVTDLLSKNLDKLKKMSPEAKKKLSSSVKKSLDDVNESISHEMKSLYEESTRIQGFMKGTEPASAKTRWDRMIKDVQDGKGRDVIRSITEIRDREKVDDDKDMYNYVISRVQHANKLRSVMKGLG